jgi:hypothetical protein
MECLPVRLTTHFTTYSGVFQIQLTNLQPNCSAFQLLQLSGIVNRLIPSSNYTTRTPTGFTTMQLEFQITINFQSSVIMIGSGEYRLD